MVALPWLGVLTGQSNVLQMSPSFNWVWCLNKTASHQYLVHIENWDDSDLKAIALRRRVVARMCRSKVSPSFYLCLLNLQRGKLVGSLEAFITSLLANEIGEATNDTSDWLMGRIQEKARKSLWNWTQAILAACRLRSHIWNTVLNLQPHEMSRWLSTSQSCHSAWLFVDDTVSYASQDKLHTLTNSWRRPHVRARVAREGRCCSQHMLGSKHVDRHSITTIEGIQEDYYSSGWPITGIRYTGARGMGTWRWHWGRGHTGGTRDGGGRQVNLPPLHALSGYHQHINNVGLFWRLMNLSPKESMAISHILICVNPVIHRLNTQTYPIRFKSQYWRFTGV